MKIALIGSTSIPARSANTIQVMKNAQALTALGHSVRVFVPGEAQGMTWPQLAQHYGLQHEFEVRWLPANLRLRGYGYALRAVRQAEHWGADLIYTRVPQVGAYASWKGSATILETHDLPSGKAGPLLFRQFLRGSGARRLVVITHALVADLNKYYRAPQSPPFTVIAPDGVDLARYAHLPKPEQARQQLNLPQGFTAGYTGHFYRGRGAQLIISIAAHLPQVHFLLVGGEPEDIDRLRAQISAEGLHNVNLIGFVPNAQLPTYQAACDLLLMPYQSRVAASSGGEISRYLSPMKMFEYLASGRPILSSDLPVLGEVLTPENALILPADDAGAWVAAIQRLQADPAHCAALATQARQSAQDYSWEKRAARILAGLMD